jgi:pimeloyl-ACP methyl ester carboxylesterase
MNPPYPFDRHYLDLDGIRLHYLDEGPDDAEPIVMLHGNPTWSFYYRKLVLALRGQYRCVVPDHIGMGLSDKPTDARYSYTLQRRVDDLDELLSKLQIKDNLTLVLHDWGGMIGMAWALRHVPSVRRLVILNTAAFGIPAGKKLPLSLRLCRTPGLGALLVRGFNLFARGAARSCVTRRRMSAEVRRAYLSPYNSWANRIAVLRFIEDIPLAPTHPSAQLVAQVGTSLQQFEQLPMLILWGARDFVFDDDFLAQWRHAFPAAEQHRFDDAGHYVLEDADDRIIPLIETFLRAQPCQGVMPGK